MQFTFHVWFASYCAVGDLSSAHKVLTQRTKTVTKIVAATNYHGVLKKYIFIEHNLYFYIIISQKLYWDMISILKNICLIRFKFD